MKAEQVMEPPTETAPAAAPTFDPLRVLREVLELEREGRPELDVEATMTFAITNPATEVVDSLGAVSVVCMLHGTAALEFP